MMQKLLLILLLATASLIVNAQGLYSHLYVYDRFDDITGTKKIKTLIRQGENTISIETKGEDPLVYFIVEEEKTGSRSEIVNLVNNLWGYERSYKCVPDSKSLTFLSAYSKLRAAGTVDDVTLDALLQRYNGAYITLRVLSSSRNAFEYKSKLAWLKLMDGTRVVYKDE